MPAARAVHKPGGARVSAAHRRAMLEIVLADEVGFSLCSLELDRGEPMRSLESLEHLRETWPDNDWYFILGEDSFLDLESWYQPEELFRLAQPVVAPRAGPSRERRSEYAGQPVIWLAGEEINLDSTSIRAELASGGSAAGLDPRVLEYTGSWNH